MEAPEITRLADRVQLRQRVLEFEKSLRLPNLNISVGRRRFEDIGQSAWVAAVSLPIPIFDRNQGARKVANFEFEQARRSAEAVRIELDAELVAAFQRLDSAVQDVTIANQEIVPSSIAAFAAVETGYREGKFGFLDVLDAQQALFDARSLSLDSHEEYLLSRTDLERLVGRTLGNRNDPAPSGSYPDPGEAR
jgi:cobalt-zinc-cadmium efflux system outer membrane protein